MRLLLPLLLPVLLSAADPIVTAFKARYDVAKANFMESAAAMPESGMDFKLTPVQRSFGDWITHTAGMNFNTCAAIVGKPSEAPKNLATLKSKADIQRAIDNSFAYCDAALANLTDEKATTEITAGSKKIMPVDAMFSYIANLNAHYGNIVGYMRMKGVTPPSTARSQKK